MDASTSNNRESTNDILRKLHRLAPNMFADPEAVNGDGPVNSPIVNDRKMPAVLRDLYKTYLLTNNSEQCLIMSVVFEQYHRSFDRLSFYKDVAGLISGIVTSKMHTLIPLDRGIRALDITSDDVFNDIEYRLNGRHISSASVESCENPYLRMLRNVLLETARVRRQYGSRPVQGEKLVRHGRF